ncbi:hypothetical protein [Pelosinus fermentans]|uniref:DUF5105 domain-containing protein n=1 Tax=Pelosinus fermentans JBW45 TaxID=1192197 RepID=I8TVG7_9FIRM|nr:hypothetical protein [Pelosinus fermentans]AJQ29421.1 hypothetical protein JBW_04088 [Pelosinus fermentans JBW45]
MSIVRKMVWIAASVMILAVIAGCGDTQPKTTPEQAAMIFCNVVLKKDFSEAEKIGIKKEDQPQWEEERNKIFRNSAIKILQAWKIKDTKNIDSLMLIVEKSTNKMEVIKVDSMSTQPTIAVVKVSVRDVDLTKFMDEVIFPVLENEDPNKLGSKENIASLFVQTFEQNMDKITLVKDADVEPFEMILTLDEKSGYWQADKGSISFLLRMVGDHHSTKN